MRILFIALGVAVAGCGGSTQRQPPTGAWKQLSPSSTPTPRFSVAMEYDQNRGKMVLFGGYGVDCDSVGASLCGGTWEFDGTTWNRANPSASPSARQLPSLAYDSDRKRIVSFGGYSNSGGCDGDSTGYCGGIWEYDGLSWAPVTTVGSQPVGRIAAAFAYDASRKKMVLFGGGNGSSTCDGLSGNTCNSTWEYDGSTWTKINVANPPTAREGAAMAYDAARRRMVLFGGATSAGVTNNCDNSGTTYCGGTWEYDGASWSRVPAAGPAPRFTARFVYAPSWGKLVLYGGAGLQGCDGSANGNCGGTWVYDGSWLRLNTPVAPAPRAFHSMAFDTAASRIILFGGTTTSGGNTGGCDGGASPCGGTWEMRQ